MEPIIPADLAPERASFSRRASLASSRSLNAMASLHSSSLLSSSSPSAVVKSGFLMRVGLAGAARRTLGIILLMVTVCLWTVSNFLASVCRCSSFFCASVCGSVGERGGWGERGEKDEEEEEETTMRENKGQSLTCYYRTYSPDGSYSKPFFVVYINSSIFAFSLSFPSLSPTWSATAFNGPHQRPATYG